MTAFQDATPKAVATFEQTAPNEGTLLFMCPGTECGLHAVPVAPGGGKHEKGTKRWGWNGSLTAPTLEPSVRVSWNRSADKTRWLNCCHSQITDGQIYFYPDSTHALAGQRVPLQPVELW